MLSYILQSMAMDLINNVSDTIIGKLLTKQFMLLDIHILL